MGLFCALLGTLTLCCLDVVVVDSVDFVGTDFDELAELVDSVDSVDFVGTDFADFAERVELADFVDSVDFVST